MNTQTSLNHLHNEYSTSLNHLNYEYSNQFKPPPQWILKPV